MTPEKTKKAFDICFDTISRFCQTDMPPRRCDTIEFGGSLKGEELKAHLRWMCIEAKRFVDEATAYCTPDGFLPAGYQKAYEKKMQKAMRWLGFVQGAMWVSMPVSIETLKMINKPEDEEV